MYGLQDQMMEDQKNLRKLDDMVTIAKESLEEIVEITNKKEGVININQIQAIALAALLKMERKGK
jgi:hypothetical protein